MCEFYPITKFEIQNGSFPLNHDCILKVSYTNDCALRFQYFSCRAQDSGTIVLMISNLYCVNKVDCFDVNNFYL